MHYEDTLYGAVELPAAVVDLLHTTPIQRLHTLSGLPVAAQYAAWIQNQPSGPAIAMKPRRVDPKILLEGQTVRLSALPAHLGQV